MSLVAGRQHFAARGHQRQALPLALPQPCETLRSHSAHLDRRCGRWAGQGGVDDAPAYAKQRETNGRTRGCTGGACPMSRELSALSN